MNVYIDEERNATLQCFQEMSLFQRMFRFGQLNDLTDQKNSYATAYTNYESNMPDVRKEEINKRNEETEEE